VGERPCVLLSRATSIDRYTRDATGTRLLLSNDADFDRFEAVFLTAELADESQLVVARYFVGDSRGARFVGDGDSPWNSRNRATLVEVQ
jgi:hypothetical protein